MNGSTMTRQGVLHKGELRAEPSGYMPGLDGLRALAVGAVILYHLGAAWAPGGLLGVNLFFVLSGYLITNILLTQWESAGRIDLKDFWLRRAKRLLPALFVMLAGVMLWALLFAPERLAALKQEVMAAILYISNWYLIFHEVSYFESFGPPSPLGHLWSLAIEEQFYLFWPLLLSLGLRFLPGRKWIVGGIAAIALISVGAMALIYTPGVDPSRVYYGTDTRVFALLLGAVPAMIWPPGKMSPNLSGGKKFALEGMGAIGLLIVLWMFAATHQYQPFIYQGGLMIFSIAAACLVVALAHPASSLARLLGWRPLRWLGKCSYGIYLWHYPVIVLSTPTVNTGGPDILLSLCQVAVSVFLAALSCYLIEDPIRYGRVKPLALGTRVSISMVIIVAVMFVASVQGGQILAQDSAGKEVSKDYDWVAADQEGEKEEPVSDIEAPPLNEPVSEEPEEEKDSIAGEDPAFDEDPEGEGIKGEMSGESITFIADSLIIDMAPLLEELLPGITVDAKKGRQMYDAPEVISSLRNKGKLGSTVIIGLGSNGAFTEKQLRTTLDCLEEAREIILINTRVPRPWEGVVNEALAKVMESYPKARLLDWHAASRGHDEYFYQDGVHLNRTGIDAYCSMIVEALAVQSADQEEGQDEVSQ